MKRRLFNLAAVVSLVLCLTMTTAIVVQWARSSRGGEMIARNSIRIEPGRMISINRRAWSTPGTLDLDWNEETNDTSGFASIGTAPTEQWLHKRYDGDGGQLRRAAGDSPAWLVRLGLNWSSGQSPPLGRTQMTQSRFIWVQVRFSFLLRRSNRRLRRAVGPRKDGSARRGVLARAGRGRLSTIESRHTTRRCSGPSRRVSFAVLESLHRAGSATDRLHVICLVTTCACERFLAPLQTWEDVRKRCDDTPEILRTCDIIERGDWRFLERCRVCGRYWVREYPFGGQHGGGPSCAYHVPHAALPAEYLTAKLVDGRDWFGRIAAVPDATR